VAWESGLARSRYFGRCRHRSQYYRPWIPSTFEASRPISEATLTVRGSAPTQHAIGNWREPTRNNWQTACRQEPEFTGPFKIRTSAMTSGYYRTSSPVTAPPMIMRWISNVPSKIVKLGRCGQFPQVDGVL
jgi:hypothetical protein